MPKEKKNARTDGSNANLKRIIPGKDESWFDRLPSLRKDLLCVAVLLALTLGLFHDIVLKDMVFSVEGDNAAAASWQHAGKGLEETEHIDPLWFPFVFSGMPAFGSLSYIPLQVSYVQTMLHALGKVLFLNAEMSWMVMHCFLGGVFMFLLVRAWGFGQLASLLAAITFMFSPYAIGLATTGHGSKLMAVSYIPLLLLFTHLLIERRSLFTLSFFAIAVGTEFLTNHVQIVYYALMVAGLYAAFRLIPMAKTQTVETLKTTGYFIVGLMLGAAISAYVYLSVNEYAQYSIRGGGVSGVPGGLNYDYATNWSFHPYEIMNFFIPSFFGFETPYYWGWMPFNDATVYIGIVPLFLGIVAFIYKRNRQTWFFIILTILVLFLSFGKHLPIIYDFFFHFVPYFDKFRVPSMVLHLMPLTFGMLAVYGFTALTDARKTGGKIDAEKLRKRFILTFGILGATLVIGLIGKGFFLEATSGTMFVKEGELPQFQQQYGAQAQQALEQLKRIRFDLLWKDFVKFALITGGILGLCIVYLKGSLKTMTFALGLIVLLTVDLFIIDTGFIDPKPHTDMERKFLPDKTVQFLKSDTDLYRIFPLGGLFQDNTWMYYSLQSVGGYSPAKLKIYQEMIDSCLYSGWEEGFPLNTNIIDMLNIKYLLAQGRLPEARYSAVEYDQSKNIVTHSNRYYMPRAWFVDSVIVARSKSEIFSLLNSPDFNPRTAAILEQQPSVSVAKPVSQNVKADSFGAQKITVSVSNTNQSLLVFSEIYYPAGWKAFIDGTETPIYKTNYILRSVVVPEGRHIVEMRFEPPLYYSGLHITNIAWGICGILIVIGLVRQPKIRARLLLQTKQTNSIIKSESGLSQTKNGE